MIDPHSDDARAAVDSHAVEYLYSWSPWTSDYGGETHHSFKRFQIIKRTAKRVFYLRAGEDIADSTLYASLEDMLAARRGYDRPREVAP
jgi:hypothetical protein